MLNKKRLEEVAKCPSLDDLASTYGRLHQGTVNKEVYEDGAKEIINRIENKLVFYCDRPNEFYGAIARMLNELKGG